MYFGNEGDLILLKDTISPPAMYWSLGRITKVFPGADGKVRVVEVKTKHQERLTRTVSKIVPLPFAEDQKRPRTIWTSNLKDWSDQDLGGKPESRKMVFHDY
ncbi:hypothetical protein LAZ67_4002907 [Cordylochernes scorpioides]|uniref:DUF5641 domain-containing protein n=1 Tax=Cordylochernes scorpioides TaxID=51811 RepID=A0ABY6KDC1_9ARAC|nr:hypothetical protein LAZ67_4002907 [Cordylochernes scorpioides]